MATTQYPIKRYGLGVDLFNTRNQIFLLRYKKPSEIFSDHTESI